MRLLRTWRLLRRFSQDDWIRLALAAADANDLDQATKVLRLARAFDPRDPRALSHAGWYLARLGRPEEAVESYDEAARLGAGPHAAFEAALVLARLPGRQEEACRRAAAALAQAPDLAGDVEDCIAAGKLPPAPELLAALREARERGPRGRG